MIFELAKIIYSALGFAFAAVQEIFSSIGLPWVSALCMMVLISVVLRLFTASFIGSSVSGVASHVRTSVAEHKKAKNAQRAAQVQKLSALTSAKEKRETEAARIRSGRSID